jgi:sugar phosphate isomerase/epimerase
VNLQRPILISVMQFEDALKAGTQTVFDVIDMAQRLGADGVELRRETWPRLDEELVEARHRIEEAGLLVTYATHATLFNDEAGPLQTLREDIDTAEMLGSPQLRIFSGHIPAADDDASWQVARESVDYAADRGIIIALENYARMPGGKLAEIKSILDRIHSPALMTNIDIGNYWLHNQDIPTAIRTVGERAISAHIKDQTGDPADPPTVPGEGVMPLDEILDELDRLPQRIIYCFEFRGGDDPEGRIAHSLQFLKRRQ